MLQTPYRSQTSVLRVVLGVFVWPQTYLNCFYLLLAFPLGTVYFFFLVTGLLLGLALIMVAMIGVPILLLVFAGSLLLMRLERELAIRLLKETIPPVLREHLPGQGFWLRVRAHVTNPVTWTGLIYLFAKFPIGIASLITVVLFAVTFGFLTAPIIHLFVDVDFGFWDVDSLGEALVLVLIGLVVGLVTPHMLNLVAVLSGRFAYLMLGARWWEASSSDR